jgi:hypothetical protein
METMEPYGDWYMRIAQLVRGSLLLVIVGTVGAVTAGAWTQGTTAKPATLKVAAAGLTNADVVKMLAAGLPESVVIQTIDAADPPTFDTTADGLIALKKAGVSDAVIQKLIARQSGKSQPSVSAQATATGGDCKIEAPGIGRVMRASGTLLPMTFQTAKVDQKTGGLIGNFFTAGIAKVKSKTTLRIDKDRSSLRITDRQPQLLDLLYRVGGSADNFYGNWLPGAGPESCNQHLY